MIYYLEVFLVLDELIYTIINGGKRKITTPIFVKEFSRENPQLNQLVELKKEIKDERVLKEIDRDINFLNAGIQGEANVAFELKNSLIPMLCLHDVHLSYKSHSIQMDFVVILKNSIILFETKKLNGDIEINQDGDFIRLYKNKNGKIYKREGIYSPIAQNERHVRILDKILREEKLIKRMPIKSYVVVANPKSIIYKKNAPKEIKNNIIKYDQITTILKRELNDKKNELDVIEKHLYTIANFLLENHRPKSFDISKKYKIEKTKETKVSVAQNNEEYLHIEKELKKFRMEMAKKYNLKPFMIFKNADMEELIKKRPQTKEELLQIRGFGQKKVEMFGEQLLEILRKN